MHTYKNYHNMSYDRLINYTAKSYKISTLPPRTNNSCTFNNKQKYPPPHLVIWQSSFLIFLCISGPPDLRLNSISSLMMFCFTSSFLVCDLKESALSMVMQCSVAAEEQPKQRSGCCCWTVELGVG